MQMTLKSISQKHNRKDSLNPRFKCIEDPKTWTVLNSQSQQPVFLSPWWYAHFEVSHRQRVMSKFGQTFSCQNKFHSAAAPFEKVEPCLSSKDFARVIDAVSRCRLNDCNSLYVELGQTSRHWLWLIQNSAARLLTGKKKYERITPVLASLLWLPGSLRTVSKILLILLNAFKWAHATVYHLIATGFISLMFPEPGVEPKMTLSLR